MSEPMNYRKKPVVIEAMRFVKGGSPGVGYEIAAWCGGRFNSDAKPGDPSDVRYTVSIPTTRASRTSSRQRTRR
jgi:hypothetical protein